MALYPEWESAAMPLALGGTMPEEDRPPSLVDEYKRLKKKLNAPSAPQDAEGDIGPRLDAIYELIVSAPVTDLGSVLDKLWFAHYCATEEEDFKEATDLLQNLCIDLTREGDAGNRQNRHDHPQMGISDGGHFTDD